MRVFSAARGEEQRLKAKPAQYKCNLHVTMLGLLQHTGTSDGVSLHCTWGQDSTQKWEIIQEHFGLNTVRNEILILPPLLTAIPLLQVALRNV